MQGRRGRTGRKRERDARPEIPIHANQRQLRPAGSQGKANAGGGAPYQRAEMVRFPGAVLPKERWVRTRVSLDLRGAVRSFDWEKHFGRVAPRVLDLGCGNGLFLVRSALSRPHLDHLGVELVPPAVKLGSLRAGQRGLSHCKFAWGDASDFIVQRCDPASVAEVHLYHPQPYFERDKAARRQLQPEVLLAVHRALVPGGLFVLQTDNPAYWTYATRVVPALFEFREHPEPWPDAPEGRTLREQRARAQGLSIFRAECRALALEPTEATRRAAALPQPDFDA